MQTDSPTYKTLKNAAFGFLGYVWPVIFAIFVTPVVVFRLGVEHYGFFVLLNTVSSLLGLLDIGVSTAMTKFLAEYVGAGDGKAAARLTGTAGLFFVGTATAGAAAMLAIGAVAYGPLGAGLGYTYFTACFALAAAIFFVNVAASVYLAVPTALQRLDVSNKLGMLKIFFNNMTILALLLSGFGLVAVLSSTLFYDTVFLLAFRRVARRLLPGISFRFVWDRTEFLRCLKFGSVHFMSNWANSLLIQLDRLIIPFLLGPAQLAYYSLPGNVTTKIQGVNGGLAGILFPMSSALQGSGDTERLKKMYVRAFRLLAVVAAGLAVPVAIFSKPILRYWLNDDFAERSWKIMVILAATYLILSLNGPLNSFLLGLGRVRILAKYSFIMLGINVAALAAFLPRYGIEGAAWAYLVAVLPVLGLFRFAEKNVLGLAGRARAWLHLALKNAVCGAVVAVVAHYFLFGLISSLWTLLPVFGFAVALYYLLYLLFGFFEVEDRIALRDFGLLVWKRLSGIWARTA